MQSSGTLVALDRRPPYAVMPTFNMRLSEWFSQDYAAIWRTQPAVRSIVGFIARNIAQLGLPVYKQKPDGDRERVREHPFPRLLETPIPGQRWMTPYRMKHGLVVDLSIFDWSLLEKVVKDGQWALVRIPPTRFTPIGKHSYWPEAFEIRGSDGSKKKEIPADQAVFFQGSIGLDDALMSTPPIESLRQLLAEDWEAHRQRQEFYRNGARTSAVIEHPKTLSPAAAERISASFTAKYTRGGTNAGGVPVLEEGMKLNPVATMTSREAQYIESRKLTREEAAAAWHVPPAMAGITAQAPFASIREQHQMLYQDTLGPTLQMIQQDFNAQLVPDFEDASVFCEFNIEEKLRGAFEQQAESLQMAAGAPWMTRNEVRRIRNLPAIAGGDELVTPLNVLIGGQASPRDSDPTLDPKAAEVVKHHLKRWADRLRRGGTLEEGRCVAELAKDLPAESASLASFIFARVAAATDLQAGIAEAADLAAV